MIEYKKVYRVSYDLIVNGQEDDDNEHPAETQFVLASNFDEAVQRAKEIAPYVRRTAVHKELVIREVEQELVDVVVGVKKEENR